MLLALPLILIAAFELGRSGEPGTGPRSFVDLAQESGANLTVFALFASTGFLLIVVVALFAGDTVPSEASWSSLRYLLAAPVPRERLIRQKLIVAGMFSTVALIFLPAWSVLVGGIAYGFGPYVGITGDQIGWPDFAGRLADHHRISVGQPAGGGRRSRSPSGSGPTHRSARSAVPCWS